MAVVSVTFIAPDGARCVVEAVLGETLMSAAVRHRVPGIEAACGGSMACGTCHAFVAEPWYAGLLPPGEGEAGILDCSLYLTATSRLTCQIIVSAALEGAVLTVPPSQS